MIIPKYSTYYEGILQLRNPNKRVVNFIYDTVAQDKRSLITKKKNVKNGIDFYFTSQHYLRTMAKRLKENFKGILKITAKLHTKGRTGEDLYRITVLFKVVDIGKGQFINYKGEQYVVSGILKNRILMKERKSGKKLQISFNDLN